MFVFLNSTYKVISIKQHFPINKYLYGRNIGYKYVSVGSIWFTIYRCFNRFLYMYKISHVTQQKMYVQVIYRKPMFYIYVLYKRHGQFFGTPSRIFFLNNVGETTFFNSVAHNVPYFWSQTRYSF